MLKVEIEKRVEELLSCMSIEEKIAQMTQIAYTQVSREQAEYFASIGIGSFLHVLGEDAKRLQDIACSSACKIPLLFGIDAIHGHALNRKATIFPTQLSMACSFNQELVEDMASATAEEVSADGLHWAFSPVLCLGRDIRWGRVGETFGEDKYLSGVLGSAMVRGYQGDDTSEKGKILACAKHYIGYGEATGARDSYDTEITYRKIRSEFLSPFEKVVNEDCATVMTAYGSIDGTPCTVDKKLLKQILKDELGFDGFVVTDWDNVAHLLWTHLVAKDIEDAVALAVDGGNDMMMKTVDFYQTAVKLANENKIDINLIDQAVRRILRIKFKLGLFENTCKLDDKSVIGCESHQQINKDLARESIVLLKNDGVLPLDDKVSKKIALIGPNGNSLREMVGDWTYFSHPDPNFDTTPERPYCTLYEGLREVGANHTVKYSKGCEINALTKDVMDNAVALAKDSDVIVFAFGDDYTLNGEGKDRANPSLTPAQSQLFTRLRLLDKPIVSVMIASKPLCVPEVVEDSSAFLTGFNLGSFGGLALAEVIFGLVNPSGKLPISFPYHVGQQPCYYNILPGWHCAGYVDMPKTPLFAFGEGLSYTTFACSDLTFDQKTLKLSVTLENTGKVAGKTTLQVYVRDKVSSLITPVKQLIAFDKIYLGVGESKRIEFTLKLDDFALINSLEKKIVEKGEFEIMVGFSSKDSDLIKTVYYQQDDLEI